MWGVFFLCWFSCGKGLIRAISCTKEEQGHRRRGKERVQTHTAHLWMLIYSHLSSRPWPLILIGTLKTHKHIPFIIQSALELSTWINKSCSYLPTQNWISSPTGSGWRKLSAPLFWFAFCLIQRQNPVFLSDPSSWFTIPGGSLPSVLRETYASTHNVPLFLLAICRALYLSAVDKSHTLQKVPVSEEGKQDFPHCRPPSLLVKYVFHRSPASQPHVPFVACFDTCRCCEDHAIVLKYEQKVREPFHHSATIISTVNPIHSNFQLLPDILFSLFPIKVGMLFKM